MESVFSQFTLSAFVVWLMQWAKKSESVPWLSEQATNINRIASAIGAIASASLISYTFDSTTGILVLSGLTWPNVASFLWSAIQQFTAQQVIYDVAYDPSRKVAPTTATTQVTTTVTTRPKKKKIPAK